VNVSGGGNGEGKQGFYWGRSWFLFSLLLPSFCGKLQ
jgi:hypothetical protein